VVSFIKCCYSSTIIIRMIRSESMKWAQCAMYVGEMGPEYLFEGKPVSKRLF